MKPEVAALDSKINAQPIEKKGAEFVAWLAFALIILVGVSLAVWIYVHDSSKVRSLTSQNNVLNTQTASLKTQIQQQADINNGVVAPSSFYKDPAGKIGLLNGAITMTMPSGWVRLPQNYCGGGSVDSNVNCEDVAAVAPNNIVKPNGTTNWSASIGVFDYNSSDGTARSWYEKKYFGDTLASYLSPVATNISEAPVSGYSSLVFQWVAQPLNNPEYTNAVYVIVHGRYGVVVNAQVQTSTVYGTNAFDYRATYQPLINQMVQSIKFQD